MGDATIHVRPSDGHIICHGVDFGPAFVVSVNLKAGLIAIRVDGHTRYLGRLAGNGYEPVRAFVCKLYGTTPSSERDHPIAYRINYSQILEFRLQKGEPTYHGR